MDNGPVGVALLLPRGCLRGGGREAVFGGGAKPLLRQGDVVMHEGGLCGLLEQKTGQLSDNKPPAAA